MLRKYTDEQLRKELERRAKRKLRFTQEELDEAYQRGRQDERLLQFAGIDDGSGFDPCA